MWSRYFGDGMGPSRQVPFWKSHGFCEGLHLYTTTSLGPNSNLIRKQVWTANHWVNEANFIRVRMSPFFLSDYSEGQDPQLLKTHFLVYSGPIYTENWGLHHLTVTREHEPGFGGLGFKQRTGNSHYSEQYGEYSESERDHPEGVEAFVRRVTRYSVNLQRI